MLLVRLAAATSLERPPRVAGVFGRDVSTLLLFPSSWKLVLVEAGLWC